jgi:nicotinate-nucleotide pyrophosphorylase (carboxylating)
MTLAEFYKKYDDQINKAIESALTEDKVRSDVTTNLVLKGKAGGKKAVSVLLCKQNCTLAGLEMFKRVYKKIDKNASIKSYYKDGQKLRNKTKVLVVKSSLRNLLAGERTALNFLQRMSAIAGLTSEFVNKLKHREAKIIHTRKTTPNFRLFEAAAVKIGGGDFHRLSLDSSVLIKDNHIKAAGTINNVLDILNRAKIPGRLKKKFEIEVKSFNEIASVIKKGKKIIKIVMLDNFKPNDVPKAAKILKQNGIKVEVSGGINMENFAKFQNQYIDFYSIGMLTHSYKSVDFSLEF